MAKKFMFVCVGILALTVAFLLGAQFGRAGYVDHSTTGIVGFSMLNHSLTTAVLMDNGEIWIHGPGEGMWSQMQVNLPVPVSGIKFWACEPDMPFALVVTQSDEVWTYAWSPTLEWRNLGGPPSGPTSARPSTWGQIKAQFK